MVPQEGGGVLEVRPGLREEKRQREVANFPVCPSLIPLPLGVPQVQERLIDM